MAAFLSVSAVVQEDYSQFESEAMEQQIINEISAYNSEQNQLLSASSVGGPVCQGMKDFSVFDLKKLALYGRPKKSSIAGVKVDGKKTWIAMKVCSYVF